MKLLAALLLAAMPAIPADSRDERWRADLAFLMAEMSRIHPGLYHNIAEPDLRQAAAELDAAIPSLSDSEVVLGLARIVASIGEAHTALWLPQTAARFRGFPVALYYLGDDLYVTAAGRDFARAAGARLVAVNGKPIAEAARILAGIIPRDNDTGLRVSVPTYLASADALHALHLIDSNVAAPFTFEDAAGERFTIDLPSFPPGTSIPGVAAPDLSSGFVPLHRRNTATNYWATYLESSRTLYFAYNRCAEMPGRPIRDFFVGLQEELGDKPIDTIVLDLRNNPGGSTAVLGPYLPGLREFHVPIRVIVGRRTASSAMIHAMDLRRDYGAVLIGETSSGKPNSWGNYSVVTLPNSGLQVNVSTKYFSNPDFPGEALEPDIAVSFGPADWFGRHDPFLAQALAGSPQQEVPRLAAGILRGRPGESIVVNGTGPAPAEPVAFLGAARAEAAFLGPDPAQPGWWQIRVTIPAGELLSGETPLFLIEGGRASNAVTVVVDLSSS